MENVIENELYYKKASLNFFVSKSCETKIGMLYYLQLFERYQPDATETMHII